MSAFVSSEHPILMSTTPFQRICQTGIVLLASYCLYNLFFHPLSRLPGPLSARLGFPVTRFHATWRKTYVWRLQSLHDKYGMTIRVGPNSVSTNDPAAVKSIYCHGSTFHKSEFYLPFASDPNNPSLFADINPHSHAIRRRAVARVYSMSSMTRLESCIEPVIKLLLDVFDTSIASSSAIVDLSKWLHFFASDAVGELAFGSHFNFLRTGSDPNRLQLSFLNLSYLGGIAGTLPYPLSTFAVRLMWPLSSAKPSVIKALAIAKVNERFELMHQSESKLINEDMLAGFFACKRPKVSRKHPDSKEENETLTPMEVAAQAMSVLGAGSDTTAGVLNGFFYFVLKNPHVYERVMGEVDRVYAKLGLGWLEDAEAEARALTYGQGAKMEYLHACIKETLRLTTPIGMELQRVVSDEGLSVAVSTTLNKDSRKRVMLTKGVNVGVSPYVYHRTEGAYGPDAAEFKPERWLGLNEEERATMERNFLAFGAGPTACIGKNISLMEITKVIPPLLHRYSFGISPKCLRMGTSSRRELSGEYSPNAPWAIQYHWFLEIDDFWVEISRRQPSNE